MHRSNTIQYPQNEMGISKHFPITHFNTPTIFEVESGAMGSVLEIQGMPFDTATHEELNFFKKIWHQALCAIPEDCALYQHTIRRKLNLGLTGVFPDAFTRSVDTQYHERFQGKSLYKNTLYLTVFYKGNAGLPKSLSFFEKLFSKNIEALRAEKRKEAIHQLEKAVEALVASLQRFKVKVLGSEDETAGYSELLSFLGSLINAGDAIRYRPATFAMPLWLNSQYTEHSFSSSPSSLSSWEKYPEGRIADYLPAYRLFFGSAIQFAGHTKNKFGKILSIKEYGTETSAIMLDPLLGLECEWISTNTFFKEPNQTALSRIEKQIVRMQNANDPAVSQIEALAQCKDDLSSSRIQAGYHHHSLLILSDDLLSLDASVNQAIQKYNDIGYVAVVETIGAEAAFWAQIPGNQKYIVRSALTTSQNFVDFSPLHSVSIGYRDHNHLGSAVTLLETPSKTPLFFNFHRKGSGRKNDFTPGHTTIIGGNGSGKTVLMGFLDSQMSRYGGNSFFFDRDRGMEIYVRATGGKYIRIRPENTESVRFNPFFLSGTPQNRQFLKSWIAQLVLEEGEAELPAILQSQLSYCVDYAYDFLAPEHRRLATAIQLLPIDFERWERLNRWINPGDLGYLFDHPIDQLDFNTAKLGFDLTELFSQPKSIFTAVCMYLMHRLKLSLDGRPVSVYFDEGWQVLDHPYWKEQLKKDLPTLRKLNAHLVLATQSPESVVNSALSAQFLDNCATNLFFCNPNADYEKHYRHFNLSVSEFLFLKETPPEKRFFLYKQAEMSAIAKLNLSHMEEALAIYSANASTLKLLDDLRSAVGDNPSVWLPMFHQERKTRGL